MRGTVFRVDATKLSSAPLFARRGARPPQKGPQSVTTVKVSVGGWPWGDGAEHGDGRHAAGRHHWSTGATGSPGRRWRRHPRGGKKGATWPVREFTKEQWEKKFVELQQHQAITVGEELWQQADWSPDQDKDEFATFSAQAGE